MSGPLAFVMGDIDLVRALGLGGIASAVLAKPGAMQRYSRHVRATLDDVDAWERADELVETLVRFARGQPEPPVLYYQEDGHLLFVSRFREQLRQAVRFVIADATLVEDLVDKARFQELARRENLPVPPGMLLEPSQEVSHFNGDLRFPIVVKPLTRRVDRWGPVSGGGKAVQIDSYAALKEFWPGLARSGVRALAQELIPGPETAIESYHVYVDGHGEIAGEYTGRKIRTYPAHHGYSSALEITAAADVATLGRALTRQLALTGVAEFEFKRAPDGRLFLIEVNPRFNLWHHPGALAGVNLPALAYADLVGRPRPPAATARTGVTWSNPWHDFAATRASGVPLWQWLRFTLGAEAKRGMAWDDPLPLIRSALWAAPRHLFRRRGAPPTGERP